MSERNNQRCKFFREEDDHHPKFENNAFSSKTDFTSQYFYCIKTMTVSGPDFKPVGPEKCSRERSCFVTD